MPKAALVPLSLFGKNNIVVSAVDRTNTQTMVVTKTAANIPAAKLPQFRDSFSRETEG